jgi:erythromycin esterase
MTRDELRRDAGDIDRVTTWIVENAHPLTTVDPRAPLVDLAPLADMVGDASVVGVGRPTHGAHELSTLTHRVVRLLVERLGFRSLALEEDWTTGIPIDEYLRTGRGDPRALIEGASPPHRTEELLDVLRWLRAYNELHPADPVRFVGLDISGVDALAYDAVAAHMQRTAPHRLDELHAYYATLRPAARTDEHTEWYRTQRDKQPYIDHARRAYHLVQGLPAGPGTALAAHHAQAIVDFYELYAIDAMTSMSYIESCLAKNTIWWHQHTGHKIVYWSGSHSAVGHARTVTFPPAPPKTGRSAGSYLREHFRGRYVSVGLSFHHGAVPNPVPAPTPGRADALLGSTSLAAYLLDLRADQPDPVRKRLQASAKLRLIGPNYNPDDDAAHHMSGGSLNDWFDIVIHHRQATPTHPLR